MVSEPRSSQLTMLERYIATPNPNYRKAITALRGLGYASHLIELVMQCWRDRSEADRPRWRHQLRLVRPDEIASDTALLVIAGGPNAANPDARDLPLATIAYRRSILEANGKGTYAAKCLNPRAVGSPILSS
jgi:PhoPQ-activated pathogenicity-related protein